MKDFPEIEVLKFYDNGLQCTEAYGPSGNLLWREVNGHDMTPPVEILENCSVVIHKNIISKEEYEKFYGQKR